MAKLLCDHQLRKNYAEAVKGTAASDMDACPLQELCMQFFNFNFVNTR